MTNLLLKLFVRNSHNTSDNNVRQSYGALSSIVSIVCNTLLSIAKIIVGVVMGLISVLADGLNNLTDCGSNVVSMVSFHMANKPADKEHPYGHQRMEYIGSMIVAFVVMMIAIQLGIESFDKILNPQDSIFSWVTVAVLAVSIIVKLWMYVFNRKLGKAIDSQLILATSIDSLSDMLATSAVLVSVVIGYYMQVNIDGYMGMAVAVVILIAGINIFRGATSDILGSAPSEEIINSVKARIMAFDKVYSMHDLEVHSYGANRYYASVHVEMDANIPSLEMHDIADRIERDFANNTNITLIVHSDPVVLDDVRLNMYKDIIVSLVKDVEPTAYPHDIRMVEGVNFTNLIFDVAIPFDCPQKPTQLKDNIIQQMSTLDANVYLVVTVEYSIM